MVCEVEMSRAVMKQALDALENINQFNYAWVGVEAVKALKAELAKPETEPVAWWQRGEHYEFVSGAKDPNGALSGKWIPLYRREDV